MDYNFRTSKENFNFFDFKYDLKLLEKSEVLIWDLHHSNKIIELYEEIKNRIIAVKNLINIYEGFDNFLISIENEIREKYPLVDSVNFSRKFNDLLDLLNNLLKLVSIQQSALKDSENLINYDSRVLILNGNKLVDYESEFTSFVKKIISLIECLENGELRVETGEDGFEKNVDKRFETGEGRVEIRDVGLEINNSEEIVKNNLEDDLNEVEIENSQILNEINNDINSNDNILVKKELEIIEPLENDELESSDERVETGDLSVDDENCGVETGDERFETGDNDLNNENKSNIVNEIETKKERNNLSNKEEPSYEELVEIIKEYFSYSDSPELSDDEKERILKNALESSSAFKYARVLWDYKKKGKIKELEDLAQKIYGNVLTDLYNYEIGIQAYSMSQSWAIWDVAKQIYYLNNPSQTDRKKYTLANPLTSEEKQIEIQDRHIGWEIYSKMTTGELDKFLNKFKDPIYRKRMVEYMIEKPNKNGTLPSNKLAELGKNVRLGYNFMNNSNN